MTIRPLAFTLFTALIITVLLGSVVTADNVYIPSLPHGIYGTIEIADGKPVPANYPVEAIGEGISTGVAGNPILTHEGGFGYVTANKPKMLVSGTIQTGDPITILVGGYPAQIWVVANPKGWQDNISFVSGEVTEVKLKIDVALAEQEAPADVYVYPTDTQTSASSGSVSYGASNGNTGGSSAPSTYVTLTPAQTSAQGGAAVTQKATPAVTGTGASVVKTGEQPGASTEVPSAQPIPASYIAGGIIIVIIIAGGAWYYSRMEKKE